MVQLVLSFTFLKCGCFSLRPVSKTATLTLAPEPQSKCMTRLRVWLQPAWVPEGSTAHSAGYGQGPGPSEARTQNERHQARGSTEEFSAPPEIAQEMRLRRQMGPSPDPALLVLVPVSESRAGSGGRCGVWARTCVPHLPKHICLQSLGHLARDGSEQPAARVPPGGMPEAGAQGEAGSAQGAGRRPLLAPAGLVTGRSRVG